MKKKNQLEIRIDTELLFEGHISTLGKEASQKILTLTIIVNNINSGKHSSLMKDFVTSQSNFSSLVSIFRSRILNSWIDKVNEWKLQPVIGTLSYLIWIFWKLESSVTMRHRNKQEIIADYFLKLENLAAKMMKEIIDIYEPN